VIDGHGEVLRAEQRIRSHIIDTPLEECPAYACRGGPRVWLKLENRQHTGSFKVRGALNKLLALTPEERAPGVVAASTGNHGAAVAYALRAVGARGSVFVPETAAPAKLRKIESLGAAIEKVAGDPIEAERQARAYAAERNLVYVSPYNDELVVGGQGTIGIEIARRLDRIDTVIASLGGGGLICGIAGYLRVVHPQARFIGCSPENSPVMIRSVEAGRILDLPSLPTLSDGTAGGVEQAAITFDLCRELVDEYVTVSETEIRAALGEFVQQRSMTIEGAAAVAIASYLKIRDRLEGQNVAIVICGGNIDREVLGQVVDQP
jgi:threonine dehydratase